MKNRTNSAEMIFQDVRKSNEEMTSSDVKKVIKMDQRCAKMDQNVSINLTSGPRINVRPSGSREGRREVKRDRAISDLWGPLGTLLGHFGTLWDVLGTPWEAFGAPLGAFGGLWGRFWTSLGAFSHHHDEILGRKVCKV